jgi:16S rRNA (adenine1518-N6/adenine1519-N6)-dimethyltransferase
MPREPLGRAATAELLDRYGIRPRKSLGQNFLADPNVVRKIVAVAGVGDGTKVLEVGAGAGTLTRALAAAGARVLAYEVDQRLRPLLDAVLEGLDVEVRFADAAAADLAAALEGEGWVMVANLPYNVGTPLLLRLLREAAQIERFVIMLQREVAERLAATVGSKVYGLPSVAAQLHGSVEIAFKVAASVFLPPPPVESAVVVIRRTPAHPLSEEAVALAAAAFGQRRKMLRRSLRGLVGEQAFLEAGIDPTRRAEQLAPGDYLVLAEVNRAR